MFKGGKNTTGDMGEDDVSIAAFQSLATLNITCEINPDSFPCKKTRKIRTNIILNPRHLTKGTGKLTYLQPSVKLTSLLVLGGGWYNHQYED